MLDTHALVWWVAGVPGLSAAAKRAIQKNTAPGEIVASVISILEIVTAVRRGRLQFSVPMEEWLSDLRSLPELRLEPVSAEVAARAGGLTEPMHGDPADRLIAATAMLLDAPLVTSDARLRTNPALKTIW